MKQRLLVGTLVAVLLAAAGVRIVTSDGMLDALCAGLGKDSPLWDILGCTDHGDPHGS